MKNKQHEYILRAFIETKIPDSIRMNFPQIMSIDSVIGGYCMQILSRKKCIDFATSEIVSNDEKLVFSELISKSKDVEKAELVFYYRLLILVESILMQYQK